MATAGAVVTILGGLSAGLSIIGYVKAANPCDGPCHDVEGLGAIPWTIAGVAGTAGGIISMSIGIPLWVVGSDDDEAQLTEEARGEPLPAEVLLRAGPSSATLTVVF